MYSLTGKVTTQTKSEILLDTYGTTFITCPLLVYVYCHLILQDRVVWWVTGYCPVCCMHLK